jgi:hypothetical protein
MRRGVLSALAIVGAVWYVWAYRALWQPPDKVTPVPVRIPVTMSPEERAKFAQSVASLVADDTRRVLERAEARREAGDRPGAEAILQTQIGAVRTHLGGTDTPAIVEAYQRQIAALQRRLEEIRSSARARTPS